MNYLLVISLLCGVSYSSSLLAVSAEQSSPVAQVGCEESVDAADDMNFVDNIIECHDKAIVIYDQASREKFLKTRFLSSQTSNNQQHDDGKSISTHNKPVHLPGTTFIIRAAYEIEAPHLALASLHQQMAVYCPKGWALDRQWSRPISMDYYLHYEFTCTDID